MAIVQEHGLRRVPVRALILSLFALSIPVASSFLAWEAVREYAALLWLLALVPAFLLAYYRGWQGVATALAAGMATLSLTQVGVLLAGLPIPDILLGVVAAYIVISMCIGWMAEAFRRDVEEVEDLAFTDLLTRLPNRRHARVFLENEFAAAERGRLLAIVLFDLDGFKDYNDRYGHPTGDEALKVFGNVLSGNTRKMNLSARFGGEEFLAVLTGTDEQGAIAFADRIRRLLRETSLPRGRLTLSAGVAAHHPSMQSPDELLAAADHALYRAKHEGRDCVRLFGHRMLESLQISQNLSEEYPSVPEETGRYPRSADELGHSPPPSGLFAHPVSGFGEGSRVLLFGVDAPLRNLIRSYLSRELFDVATVDSTARAEEALESEFDLVVCDLTHAGEEGAIVIEAAKTRRPGVRVIAITRMRDSAIAAAALSAGADQFLHRPFGMPELRQRLIEALDVEDSGAEGEVITPEEVGEEVREVGAATAAGAEFPWKRTARPALGLARGCERRDPYLKGHSARVWAYARILADAVDPEEARLDRFSLEIACRLHDVGRMELGEEITHKHGPLTAAEAARVREHPTVGRRILEPVLDDPIVLSVVEHHHEWWDGSGYPDGLFEDQIPFPARLVALADALDAMSCPRPHREALAWEAAVEEIRKRSGRQFDPEIVRAFLGCLPALRNARDGSVVRTPT